MEAPLTRSQWQGQLLVYGAGTGCHGPGWPGDYYDNYDYYDFYDYLLSSLFLLLTDCIEYSEYFEILTKDYIEYS